MRRISVISGVLVAGAFAVAACGGTPAASGLPTVPPINVPSVAIPSIPPIGSIAIPSIPPIGSIPLPTDIPDPDLAARFPTTLPGTTVGPVHTGRYMLILLAFLDPDAQQQFASALVAAGVDPNTLSYGQQAITFTESNDVVELEGIRTPGGDAGRFVNIWPQLQHIAQPDESPATLTQTTIGGKPVVALNDGGDTEYLYTTGDVAWRIVGGDEAEITAILNALH